MSMDTLRKQRDNSVNDTPIKIILYLFNAVDLLKLFLLRFSGPRCMLEAVINFHNHFCLQGKENHPGRVFAIGRDKPKTHLRLSQRQSSSLALMRMIILCVYSPYYRKSGCILIKHILHVGSRTSISIIDMKVSTFTWLALLLYKSIRSLQFVGFSDIRHLTTSVFGTKTLCIRAQHTRSCVNDQHKTVFWDDSHSSHRHDSRSFGRWPQASSWSNSNDTINQRRVSKSSSAFIQLSRRLNTKC